MINKKKHYEQNDVIWDLGFIIYWLKDSDSKTNFNNKIKTLALMGIIFNKVNSEHIFSLSSIAIFSLYWQ